MRVIKHFDMGCIEEDKLDSIAESVSSSFDDVLRKFFFSYRYSWIKLVLGSCTGFSVEGDGLVIHINYGDYFVKNMLKKGIRAIIMQQIALSFVDGMPGFLGEIAANRSIVRKGFGEDLMFYYFVKMVLKRSVDCLDDFLEVSVSWLSFYGLDNFYSSLLMDMKNSMAGRKFSKPALLIEKIKGMNMEKNRDEVLDYYRRIVK